MVSEAVRLLGEGLPAGGALVGPPAHVGPHVDEEARVLREGLAAPDAPLGLLPGVRSLMDDQAGLLGERSTSHTRQR